MGVHHPSEEIMIADAPKYQEGNIDNIGVRFLEDGRCQFWLPLNLYKYRRLSTNKKEPQTNQIKYNYSVKLINFNDLNKSFKLLNTEVKPAKVPRTSKVILEILLKILDHDPNHFWLQLEESSASTQSLVLIAS